MRRMFRRRKLLLRSSLFCVLRRVKTKRVGETLPGPDPHPEPGPHASAITASPLGNFNYN